ncbi:dihydrofolate reductase family protein [Krasilnikoviella flava]|uniref:Pyrimidine reductase, riboflavin biosynthesis n=1 Tax=Krasilnikoviella flava TaxID=526729 RepID=A0A1T5L8W4_9MICO|nr:dihydrofolate reductase family protein [Krasilnikoviella flava]SKC72384.1 Pyrimidine reductase, riboflavin biosynthesis [Krasilnikoviella flava]
MRSATTPLDLLVPGPEHLPADPAERRLDALYSPASDAGHGPYVQANFVSTVDGGAWGPDHLSGSINDDADWRVFRVLRAAADVVLVGAGTARHEGYTALDRPRDLPTAGDRPLELALVTRSGRVPQQLADGDRPPLVLTGQAGARTAARMLPPDRVLTVASAQDPDDVDLRAGLAALAARGLARVLCEGGPTLLATLLAGGLVDELCVTTSPCLVGPGPSRIVAASPAGSPGQTPPAAGMPAAPPVPARLAHLLHAPDTGTLLARWLLR